MPRASTLCCRFLLTLAALGTLLLPADHSRGADAAAPANASSDLAEFFETKVRPLLAEKCFECHSGGAKAVKGGLRLDTRGGMLTGGDSGEVVVPGKPDASPLVDAVRWKSLEMPPNGKLRDDQIAVLVKWVELGAPWPDSGPAAAPSAPPEKAASYDWPQLREQHWAWQPVRRPELPPVRNHDWPLTAVDVFLLARLETAGLKPSPAAAPNVLARRIYFDLIGLPPTPAELAEFEHACAKDRQRAVRELADRLLDSPHYGERWGRHWLDVARYNDGLGGDFDDSNKPLPNAWRYRDWVVAALNRDLPYNQFLRLQVAGDLIDPTQAVATGLLAVGPTYQADGGDPDSVAQAAAETLDDRVDTISRGILALTVSCARCHDHKFDPIPQLDYYSLAGVLRNAKADEVPLVEPELVQQYEAYQQQIRELDDKIRKQPQGAAKEKRPLTAEEKAEIAAWKQELARLKSQEPAKYPFWHTVAEAGAADMTLAVRGNPRKPGPLAPRRFLRIVSGPDPPRFHRGSGRLELADALVSPTNPLTTRVLVNRVWQRYFGRGLVRTASNFGKLGEAPTHPELLDWLASTFMSDAGDGLGWSLKRLHRLIVTSATYQMDSRLDEQSFAVDGDNRLMWRMNPRQLDAEAWRDGLLSASGELDLSIGGPPIPDIAASTRRTLYAAVSRKGDAYESDRFLRLFDFPQARATSEGRNSSIVPQQALFMLNNPLMADRARALAARLEREATSDEDRIELAYRLLYARSVTQPELARGLEFLARETAAEAGQLLPWQQYAQVLLSANEMIYLQ